MCCGEQAETFLNICSPSLRLRETVRDVAKTKLPRQTLPWGRKEISRIIAASKRRIPRRKDRDGPLTEMIAKKIIKIAQTGVHDVAPLSAPADIENASLNFHLFA
jgi:hypothetical protein